MAELQARLTGLERERDAARREHGEAAARLEQAGQERQALEKQHAAGEFLRKPPTDALLLSCMCSCSLPANMRSMQRFA
jgi:hypothetical protein